MSAAASAASALAMACGNGAASASVASLGGVIFERHAAMAATANLIISPLSVYLALVLALNAAGAGSQTQAELLRVLCAASEVGLSGFASLAPGGGLPAEAAAAAEAAVNDDIAALARALATTPPPVAAAAGGGAKGAAASSSSPSSPPLSPGSAGGSSSSSGSGSGSGKNTTTKTTTTTPAPGAPELLLANSLWTQSAPAGADVSPDYAARMAALLGATARRGDAAAVNAWASKATKGLIDQAVAPGTRFDLLLANAVYFKGSWERAFDKGATQPDADFSALKMGPAAAETGGGDGTNGGGGGGGSTSVLAFSPKKVGMMSLRVKASDDRAAYRLGQRSALTYLTPGFVAARLPYRGGRQSAVLVLPTDKGPGALQALLTTGGGGGNGGGGPSRFDWRRDLALDGPVPEPWAKAVAAATGKILDELTNPFGLGGGPQAKLPPPPTKPPPRAIAAAAAAAGSRGPANAGSAIDDAPIPLPRAFSRILPRDPGSWMPASARSTGGLLLKMPKFRAETKQLRLKNTLAGPLGLPSAFDAGAANFSRAFGELPGGGGGRLAIDDVIHSAVVVVDEEGTEAAAVTAVVMMRSAAPLRVEEDPPVEIILDRPFLFAVVDDATGTPMFTGSVTDPVWR